MEKVRIKLRLLPKESTTSGTRVGSFHKISGEPHIILRSDDIGQQEINRWSSKLSTPGMIKEYTYKKVKYIQIPLECFEEDEYVYIGRRLTMSGWGLSDTIYANHNKVTSARYFFDAQRDDQVMNNLSFLSGKILVCWCMGKKGKEKDGNFCHGQALVHLVEAFL